MLPESYGWTVKPPIALPASNKYGLWESLVVGGRGFSVVAEKLSQQRR